MDIHLPHTISRFLDRIGFDDSLCLIWAATMALAAVLVCRLATDWLQARMEKKAETREADGPAGPPTVGHVAPKRLGMKQRLALRAMPLLAPALNLPALYLGVVVMARMGYDAGLLDSLKPLAYSWLFVTMIYVITDSIGKTVFVGLLLIPGSMPFVVPYLREVADALREMSLTVGKTEITAFMVVKLLIIGVLMLWITAAVNSGIHMSLERVDRLRWSTRQLLENISSIAVYAIAGLMVLSMLGIDLTAFAVLGGAVGVGLGLGLQKIASNFISGLILLSEQSIQVNDMIEIAGSGITGLVKHTGARYTMVETIDNREMMIPNDDLITNRVINWTFTNSRGVVSLDIGVSYESDLDLVREQLLAAATSHENVLADPPPACLLVQFGASSVDFKLIAHVEDVRNRRAGVMSDIYFDIWRRFKEHKIEIPYPQMVVHRAQATIDGDKNNTASKGDAA